MTDKKSAVEPTKNLKPNNSQEMELQFQVGQTDESPTNAIPQPHAYSMRPAFGEMFPLPIIKNILNTTMSDMLKDKTYDKDLAHIWTRKIADEINQKISNNPKVQRYKHVVQVMLGQEMGAGCRYISRSCWDTDCDTKISDVFSNTSLFCICVVFATYQY